MIKNNKKMKNQNNKQQANKVGNKKGGAPGRQSNLNAVSVKSKAINKNKNKNKKETKQLPPPPMPIDSESDNEDVPSLSGSELEDDDASSVDLNESVEQPSADDLLSSNDEDDDNEVAEEAADMDEDDDDESETEQPAKKREKKPKLVRTPEEQEARRNATSVFVGNLPLKTDHKKVEKLFSKFGEILSVRFRTSFGSKIFKAQSKVTGPNVIAFVDFKNESDAKLSLAMNGEKVGDKVLRVDLHRNTKNPKESYDPKRTVFVGNLKFSVNDDILHKAFSCCGAIDYVRTLQSPKGCNGTAFVCFKDSASVINALKLNSTQIEGRDARVNRYEPSKLGGRFAKKDAGGGAARRIKQNNNNKVGKGPGGSPQKNNKNGKETGAPQNKQGPKKENFAGVKNDQKKKNKQKQKGPKGQKALAKKIAPKA